MAIERKQTEKPKNVLPKPGLQKKEIIKRNTHYSKTFLNPNGTFTAEISSTPANYKNKSGNWRTVDNTLISKSDGSYDYENKDNAYKVQFARNNSNGKLMRLELDSDHWITFTPVERFTQLGTTKDNSIVYKNIKQGIDLEYALTGDTVKERIILNSPGINQFRFELSYQGIRMVKETDGTIWVIDAVTGETLMYFRKSYAEDSKNNITTNISNDIVNEAGKEILVITVDSEWLSKAVYPVILDPVIEITTVLSDPSNIYDTYIASGYPTNNYYTNSYLHAGNLTGYNTIRSLIKFLYLPSLPPGAKITSAYLSLFMYLSSTGGTTVNAYRITDNWNVTNVNWSNQPGVDSTPVVQNFTATPNTEWQMDITSAVQAWYSGDTPNYGLMLRASNEANSKISFFSSNAAGHPIPELTLNYEFDVLGSESYSGFHDNVNVHNGNLVLTNADVTLPGRGIPISIQRTYNLRSDVISPIGNRWTLNVYMKLNFSDGQIVKLTDSDGTIKYFTKGPDDVYRSPSGVTDILLNENGVYILEDKSGIRYTFTSDGRLDKITDTKGNITDILYLADDNINKIVDPSGRQVVFNYSGGKLASITGNEIPTIEYTYTGNELTRVAIKDASGSLLTETLYNYDDVNRKITITDALSNTTDIIYTVASGRQVNIITKKLTIDSVLQTLTTSYSYQPNASGMVTTVTDPLNKITEYTTNNMGNIAKIIEDKGGLNITTQFEWDEQQNLVEETDPKGAIDPDPAKYKTVSDYNEKGDIKRITNSQGYSTIYNYNIKSDPTEVIDYGKKTNINNYDPNTRNLLTASDPLFSTNVMKYDAYGNIISQTDPIGIGGNMVINSGFENWSGGLPSNWTIFNPGGTINNDISEKVNGDHSVRLESPGNLPSQQTIILSDFIPVNESVRYNISWYVKTLNAGSDYGGATADIHWYNQSRVWMGSQYVTVNAAPTIGTTDTFIRKGTQVSSPINARYAKIALGLTGGSNNTPATAWFDDVQFELGSVINQYNLIYNAGFELDMDEDNFPDGWIGTNLTSQDVLDTGVTRSDTGRSLKLIGSAALKSFNQEIQLTGTINTPIRILGWSKASGWSSLGGSYGLKIEFYNDTTLIGSHVFSFSGIDANWHQIDKIVLADSSFTKLKLYGIYENQTGTAWFDDFVVRLAEAPNSLMSDYNITQNGSFEYDNNQTNWPDEWIKFNSTTPGTYDMTWVSTTDTQEAYSGNYVIRIANVPDWAVVANAIVEPIKAGMTYTASAVIKTNNVSGSGAVLKFDILDNAGVYLGQKVSETITSTQDWTRVIVTLSETEAKAINSGAARFRVSIGTLGSTSGEMYFDAVRVLEGNLLSQNTYDINGNYSVSVRNQLGYTVSMINDSRGNVTQITDAKNNITKFIYDKFDKIKQIENSRGLISLYYYDRESNLTQIDNHQRTGPTTSVYLNTTITTQYNEQLLPKRITDGNWRETYLEYNKNTQLKDIKFPNGKQIHYQYDAVKRLQSVTYTGDTTQWSYGYDANSNMTSIVKNGTETITREYDNLDRMTKEILPAVFGARDNIQYSFNPSGQIVSTQYSKLPVNSQQMICEYDQASNNMVITGPNNISAEFMYDEEARLKKTDIRNNVMKYSTYNDYDAAGRITRLRIGNKNGTPVIDYSYQYDANDNRIKDINNLTGKRVEYSYDTINQLTEESYFDNLTTQTPSKRITHQFDLLGNRTQKSIITGTTTTISYSYNAANEIININGSPQYYHDYNGNMTGAYGYTFTYNAENQLVRIDLSGVEIARYEYDYKGLRTRKITSARTERYYYEGDNLVYVTEENSSTQQNKLKYFFTRDTSGQLMHMIDYTTALPKTYWYILDVHGNVVALADDNGNRVVNYEYDAWGNLTNTPEAVTTGNGEYLSSANPFRYSSYQFDSESGLYYLKARYYTATLGRFLTRDTLYELKYNLLSINQYRYCDNNPTNFSDPSGFFRVRTNDLATSIDLLIYLVPAVAALNSTIKKYRTLKYAYTSIGKGMWINAIEEITTRVLTKVGFKRVIASQIISIINTSALTITDLSIGKIIVWALGKIFRVETVKEKKYYYWGPVVHVDYIVFW